MTLEERISALATAIGSDIKLLGGASPDINAIDNLTGTGLIERTGDGTADLVSITAAGKALIDDPNSATQRATLGLGNVDNTADADKPVSTATQTALSGKADKATTLAGYGITDAAPSSHVGTGGSSHADATTAVAGFMSSTDKAKLDGVQAGAQVNSVTSVAGKTGAITLDKSDVGLGNVDNTADVSKPISSATQTALDAKVSSALIGAASGVAPLDATSKIPTAYLPSFVDDVLEYATLSGFPGTGESGKIYTALDTNKIYRWSGSVYIEISGSPGSTDAVSEGSTNLYFTGTRVLATLLTGLSTATNAAIVATDSVLSALGKLQKQISDNLSTLTTHTGNTGNPHGTTAAQVGLGNVNNTSDANKPISTATQTALDAKANTTGGNVSGTWPISVTGSSATAGKVSGDGAATLSSYALPNTGGSSQWMFLGTWSSAPQSGAKVHIDITIAAGYNASINQNAAYKVYFKTSNNSSSQSGSSGNFYADGMAWKFGPSSVVSTIRVVQTSTSSYAFYLYCGAFTGDSSVYMVSLGQGAWTDSATLSAPSGNFVDLPIYSVIDSSVVGVANGVAPLDSSGKVPAVNLPSGSAPTLARVFFMAK